MQDDRVYSYMAPAQSYLDLVIQRMLVAFLIQKSKSQYASDDELRHIAHHCTRQANNAKIYEESVQMLSLALKLQKIPQSLPAVVQSASEERIDFTYPFVNFLKGGYNSTYIPLRHLKPGKRPGDGEVKGKSIQLNWKNRVYSTEQQEVVEVKAEDGPLWLSTDALVNYIPLEIWQEMTKIVKDRAYEELEDLAMKWQSIDPLTYTKGEVKEVSCEKVTTPEGSSEIKKYVEFNRQFCPGHMVELQLCSQLHHGIPEPKVQLFKLTQQYDICLEHRALPVECFTEIADRLPKVCHSIQHYIEAWSPVLKMLIAYNTVVEDETILIHNVAIRWSKGRGASTRIFGHFALDKEWCEDRQIILSSLPKKGKKRRKPDLGSQQDPGEEEPALLGDYICVRGHHYKLSEGEKCDLDKFETKQQDTSLKTNIAHPEEMTVVAHGLVGRVNLRETKEAESHQLQFEVTQMSCELPERFFKGGDVNCTVELIPKSESVRRMEAALADVGNSGSLIESIVLQNPCPADDELKPLLEAGEKEVEQFRPSTFFPNESQMKAISAALTRPFTVIQGPPGTGKTKTGALITILFHRVNQRVSKPAEGMPRKQIIYCGPSNKSVDVIAKDLHFLKSRSLKMVRVYSDTIEQQEFPIPGVESAEAKFAYNVEEREEVVRDYALHHLIRSEAGAIGKQMTEMYNKLKKGTIKPTIQNIRAYVNLVKEAKIKVLKKKDVILCTCNAAGHFIIKQNLNVVQCIIDEAGMCMELDTLIPFVCQKPKQVVLIGDHKQLRPIIKEPRVKQLGAEKSLMEKCEGEARSLNIQYRMHEEICNFPSRQFYDNRLQTDTSVKERKLCLPPAIWPGSDHHPRVFCHIEGVEDSLTVKTAEGSENSKSNEIEANATVRIAKYLIRELGVKTENLVVLSQYNLQCKRIQDKLHRTGVMVQTITRSQGSEWDFVILSTVRSLPEYDIPEIPGRGWRRKFLGFIEDENQMNVGLTRARRGLIIVGNKNLLATCKTWRKLIKHYNETGSVVDAETFLQPL